MLGYRDFTFGSVKGNYVEFFRGDILPVHIHDDASNHITVVLKGKLKCLGDPEIEGKVIEAGQVKYWPPNQPHGFEALEPAKIMQIRTGT